MNARWQQLRREAIERAALAVLSDASHDPETKEAARAEVSEPDPLQADWRKLNADELAMMRMTLRKALGIPDEDLS